MVTPLQHGRDAHRLFAVGDEGRTGFARSSLLPASVKRAADISLVEGRIDFIQNAERAGLCTEKCRPAGRARLAPFRLRRATRALQALAGRGSDYVDTTLGGVLLVGELHEGVGRRRTAF